MDEATALANMVLPGKENPGAGQTSACFTVIVSQEAKEIQNESKTQKKGRVDHLEESGDTKEICIYNPSKRSNMTPEQPNSRCGKHEMPQQAALICK